jgi:hypothetical protein
MHGLLQSITRAYVSISTLEACREKVTSRATQLRTGHSRAMNVRNSAVCRILSRFRAIEE